MIEPKFRELMLAAETGRFRMRFWFNQEAPMPRAVTQKIIHAIEDAKNNLIVSTANFMGAERALLDVVEECDRLAAYEILDRDSGNGIVGYLEWP